jgi:hypothetical protein
MSEALQKQQGKPRLAENVANATKPRTMPDTGMFWKYEELESGGSDHENQSHFSFFRVSWCDKAGAARLVRHGPKN